MEHWIAEARDGDREALDRLLALCRPYLLVAANQDFDAALSARLAPSDVVQESLLEAARDFPGFRGQSETDLLAWLRRILRNNLANARRRHVGTAMRSATSSRRTAPAATSPTGSRRNALLCRLTWLPGAQINALTFAPDGKTLAAALHDGRIALWQAATDAEVRQAAEWQRGP